MDDEASATGSLHAQLNAAKADAAALTAQIGTATDAAGREGATASLHAQLNAAKADVTRLEGVIGAATAGRNAARRGDRRGDGHRQHDRQPARTTQRRQRQRDAAYAGTGDGQRDAYASPGHADYGYAAACLVAGSVDGGAQQQVTTLTAEVTRLRAAGTTTTTDTTGTTGTTGDNAHHPGPPSPACVPRFSCRNWG